MDFYADMPMPSFDERVQSLLKLVKNPTDNHVALASRVASETMNFSYMGYTRGGKANEERRFLEAAAQGGSSDTS